jgi:hypothetical protein
MFSHKNKNKNEARRPTDSNRTGAPVFSYAAQRLRTEENTVRVVHEPPAVRHNWFVRLPTIISIGVILGSLLYATTLTTTPRIIAINNQGQTKLLRDEAYYEQAFSEVFGKSLLNHSKLSINTNQLARTIENEYPELHDVAISLPLLGRRPVVQITSSRPAFILLTASGSYLISEDGRVILNTNETSLKDAGLATVTDNTGLVVSKGEIAFPKDNVDFITTVLLQLKAKNITTESITLPPISNDLHIKLQGRPYFVKFNLQGSALEQTGALLAIEDRLKGDGNEPSEYIDVRVEDRAYIK